MELHQDTFSTFTDHFPSHINRMRTTSGNRNSWGTHTEIFALATMLQTKVFVFCEYAGRFQWTQFLPLFEQLPPVGLHGLHFITIMHCGEHYDTIKSSKTFCDCMLSTPVLKGKSAMPIHTPSNSQSNPMSVSITKIPPSSKIELCHLIPVCKQKRKLQPQKVSDDKMPPKSKKKFQFTPKVKQSPNIGNNSTKASGEMLPPSPLKGAKRTMDEVLPPSQPNNKFPFVPNAKYSSNTHKKTTSDILPPPPPV